MTKALQTPFARLILAILAVCVFAAPAVADGSIALHLSARLEAGDGPVTLSQVAKLTGDAADHGDLVILERADAVASISLSDIRAKLKAAGANFGRLTLSGASCRIELPTTPAAPPKPKPERARTGPNYQVVALDGAPTIRTAIAHKLAALHAVPNTEIQLAFDDKDAATLDTAYTARQIVQVQTAASTSSSRVPLRITVFAGDKVVADHRLTVDVLLLKSALIATRDLDRRDRISESDVREEPRWVAPGIALPLRSAIVGSSARCKMKAGAMFASQDLESPVLVKRGDIVYVQCLSGSVVVQARARALAPGREGEEIAFQMEGSEDAFTARVAGRGRAVMVTNPGGPAPVETPEETVEQAAIHAQEALR